MAWFKNRNDVSARLPVKLTGEAGSAYWIDQDGDRVNATSPYDYPNPVVEGASPFPQGKVPEGEATIQKVFDEVKSLRQALKDAGVVA